MAREDIYLLLSMGWGAVFLSELGAETSEGLALEYQNLDSTTPLFQAIKKRLNVYKVQFPQSPPTWCFMNGWNARTPGSVASGFSQEKLH